MSCKQINYILSDLSFTNIEVPYEYGFFHMRQLKEVWNHNMDQNNLPSWINVLYYSIMECFNKWYPGFMCVVCKPHSFGDEQNTICCALNSIIWRAHIVEGKYRKNQLIQKKWGILLGSYYECVSQYFRLESVLCLTLVFVCQRLSQPCWILVSTQLLSSRSANTFPRLYQ